MTAQIDEETPLLSSEQPQTKKKPTPLPWFQFSIVLFLQLAEPLTSQVIYPFAPQLIRDLGITNGNESQVGYYVGLMQSIFFLTQAFTVLHWSRISDRVGRKPVILTGLLGLSISMYCFGLSRTFWGLVLSRSLNGALNGNIGVIKSMMAEMTDTTNISKAYAYMPIAWSTGGTLGPIIGGSLARPAERFPHLFGQNEFLKKYPYFLPCAVPATFSLVAWIVTFLFLKETVRNPISPLQLLKIKKGKANGTLQNVVGSQDPSASSLPTVKSKNADLDEQEKPMPLRSLLTPRVVIAAANYAFLSLVDISFRAIQPLFFSTPIHLGGLGLPPSTIGNILSVFGVLNGVFQVFFFAQIHDRWGSKKVFIAGIASAFPVFLSFPVINYLAKMEGLTTRVWAVVAFQIVISIMLSLSYGAIFIFISAASPNRASLGATNGLSQMTVSVMRAIGPAAANSLFSLSIDKGYLGGHLVYYVLLGVVAVSMVVASMLPRHIWTN
ncbi:member of major facilitator superfamily multidrug-resistance, DHA1 sub-family [Crucibulum laeve]|uniref:Member of major facilitator superfamily multidrug-resistance, DHA1 sub-family n=1 Tax=Crucibulum laeve TaxID=68775 RepID=A0A5C3LSH8_9AGAR|nr:member of major facilitator superfamily multidrug-resistance, DHA1 sub-family [Crucibulum laeve]